MVMVHVLSLGRFLHGNGQQLKFRLTRGIGHDAGTGQLKALGDSKGLHGMFYSRMRDLLVVRPLLHFFCMRQVTLRPKSVK